MKNKIFFVYNDFHANYSVGVKKYPMLLYPIMMNCFKKEIPFGIIIFSTKSDGVIIQDGFRDQSKDKIYNCLYKILNLFIVKRLINRLFKFKRYFYFEYLLKIKSVKIAICLSPKKEFCRSMNLLQIMSVELNHAVGYSSGSHWWHRRSNCDVCKLFLSLDKFSTSAMKRDFLESKIESKIFELKHPMYSDMSFLGQSNSILTEIKRQTKGFEHVILFSQQWGYSSNNPIELFKGIIEEGVIHQSIIELIKRTTDDIFWLIRIHPLQSHDDFTLDCLNYLKENNPNVDWEFTSNCNLVDLLSSKIITAHLTMSSQTMFDCYYFGIPSAFLCPTLSKGGFYEVFGDNVKKNRIAESVELNVVEIEKWIVRSKVESNHNVFEKLNDIDLVEIDTFLDSLI